MIDIKELLLRLAPVSPTGATTHQEGNFMALLEPKLRKVFYETYEEVPEQYSKIFNVKDSSKAQETDFHLGAMAGWTKFGGTVADAGNGVVADANAMPTVHYQKISPAQTVVYTHQAYAEGFMVQREFIDDEQYGVIEKMTKDLARAGRYKVENDAISVLNNAFTNTGYDGKPLCAADHPLVDGAKTSTLTCSNLVTGVLSDVTLKEALKLGRKQRDNAGKLTQMKFDTLIVPPALEFTAIELMKTTQKVDSDFNNVNPIAGRFKIIVNDFLTSDTAWFIQDSKRHELNFFWRKKVEFKREEDFDSYVSKYKGYMRYSYGYSDFRGIIGSKGVAV